MKERSAKCSLRAEHLLRCVKSCTGCIESYTCIYRGWHLIDIMCREHELALKTPHLPSNPSQPCLVSKIYCVASLPHQGHLPTAEVADQPQGQEFFYLRWCRPMGSHGQTKAQKGGTREAERGAMNLLEHQKISCASFDWMSNQFRLYMCCTISIAVWSCKAGLHIDLITIFCGHAALGFLGFPDLQGLPPNTSHSHAKNTTRRRPVLIY